VTNFSRDGFSQDELETLFHEFGHVMHGALSQTRYSLNAGTTVKRDFVEAPSQMYEEWVRRPEAFGWFNQVCPSCKPIDLGLIDRLNQARRFGQGARYARQRLFAAYDMALSSATPGDPLQVWREMENATPLGHFEGTQFPGTFGHIVGGYAAGYYGYMWSEVLAQDMLSAFGDNVMNPATGMRYRKTVLEQGGQADPNHLVSGFLGRKPNSLAFFRHIGGQPELARQPAAAGVAPQAGAIPAAAMPAAEPDSSAMGAAVAPAAPVALSRSVTVHSPAAPPPVAAPAPGAPAWPIKPIELPQQQTTKVELRVDSEAKP